MGVTTTSPLPIASPAYEHYARALAERRADATLRPLWLAAVAVAVLLGAALRLGPVLAADFPLNDGGLFYRMTAELRAAGYVLPAFTSYNSAGIPYAYPPLGFYLAGFTADVTGRSLLDVVRVLPAVVSTLTIPVFFLLARNLLGSSGAGAMATVTFALLPRSFSWFIMGGGLTRAPGFLFALLVLHQVHLMYTRPERRHVAIAAVAGAAAVASHLENAWFAAYSAALLLVVYGRDRRSTMRTLVVGLGVVALSAPWWATVVLRHGLQPFRSAAQGGEIATNPLWLKTFNFTDEPQLTLFGVLGLIGLFVALADRRWLFPLWLGAIYLLNPRNPQTVAAVPLAMLAALALHRVVVPGILRVARSDGSMSTRPWRQRRGRVVAAALLAFLMAYAFLGVRRMRDFDEGFRSLGAQERSTLEWIARNTSDDARILVLTFEPEFFGYDRLSEWMPALIDRRSVATVQGYEWLPGREFDRRLRRYADLGSCSTRDVACVEGWARAGGTPFTHVLLRKEGCCTLLDSSLRASPSYRLLTDRPDAALFAHAETP
jgi:hypothetical protein